MPKLTSERHSDVSVIIVNYNGGDLIQTAVNHLRVQSPCAPEIIIVDNASTDGSTERLDLSGLPQARLIRLKRNIGFAAASNLGARESKGGWLAFLNPDTEPDPRWLEELILATSRHPTTAMFASAQIDAKDPNTIDGAGDCYFVLGIPWRGGFGRPLREMPEEGECFSPCGASAFIRRDAFERANGFDDSYFCYCEDVDLGFRMRLAGERCIFVPSAIVKHHGSAITGRYSDFTVRLGTRNRHRTYLTSMPPVALALTFPGHLLASFYLYVRTIGKPQCKASREGIMDALRMMPDIIRRRKLVQKSRTISSATLMRAMCFNVLQLHRRKPHIW